MLFEFEPLFAELGRSGLNAWSRQLRQACTHRLTANLHGKMPEWLDAYRSLPEAADVELDASGDAVAVRGSIAASQSELQNLLMRLHPWRKGPFEFFGLSIDTEWRSDWKWQRLAGQVDWRGKAVLDVGCGNGYYGWRMLDAGAAWVLGCEPFPLYLMQYEIFHKYAPPALQHWIVPLTDDELPHGLNAFDITLSMGVLYHRSSPIDHLLSLWHSLKPGGELILETLILDSPEAKVLVPPGRYAKMRNVWFIPSLPMLDCWLARTGFQAIRVLDETPTSPQEQRRTPWMTFESLSDFLDPRDSSLTLEGHPAPLRAIVSARKA